MIRVLIPIIIVGLILAGCNAPPANPINTDAVTQVYNEGRDIEPSKNVQSTEQLVISNLTISNFTSNSARITFDKNLSVQILGRLYKGEKEIGLFSAEDKAIEFKNLEPSTNYMAVLFSNNYPNYDKRIEFYTANAIPVFPTTSSYYGYGGWYYVSPAPVVITIWTGSINIEVE